MATVISPWQKSLYPSTSRTPFIQNIRNYPLIGRVALLPIACTDALLETIKRITDAIFDIAEGVVAIFFSALNSRDTVKGGITAIEQGMESAIRIPMIPVRFVWQIFSILKDGPAVSPLYCNR